MAVLSYIVARTSASYSVSSAPTPQAAPPTRWGCYRLRVVMMSRHVTLVCGPPCAGKTTYVRRHARPGDLVLDADMIAQQLGSPRQWMHALEFATEAQDVMARGMAHIARMDSGTAWVIRGAPDPAERMRLARTLRADRVLVLLPDRRELHRRAQARPHSRQTRQVIARWLAHYRPAPCDTLVR